jgi:4-hydroxy-3-methylbut-2-enyl diphosphate reductase
MKIILPDKKYLGPCQGIRRATERCLAIKNKNDFVIYGEIAHNLALCDRLKKEGFAVVDSLKDLDRKKVIIRPHGISQKDQRTLKKGAGHIDLTCPFVKNLLNKSLRLECDGYQIIIIGDSEHVEIKNVRSFLKNAVVVEKSSEVMEITKIRKAAVLTQTTQTLEKINKILPLIKKRVGEMLFVSTRCDETDERQKEARKLSENADLILVVGDKTSENANNLVKVAREKSRSELVGNAKGLAKILRNMHHISNLNVGAIASASTPTFVVDEVIKCLKKKTF